MDTQKSRGTLVRTAVVVLVLLTVLVITALVQITDDPESKGRSPRTAPSTTIPSVIQE